MGTAMHYAVDDIKYMMGVREPLSDNEEKVENDEDYKDMAMLKKKYFENKRVQRKRSDESVNSNFRQRGEDLY